MDLLKNFFKGDKAIWIIYPVPLLDIHYRGIQCIQYTYLQKR